ncbi:MAG: hypothetical protein WDO73_14790 [Ignavibacteriota bacterium]
MKNTFLSLVAYCVLTAVATTSTASAQEAVNYGSISGRVQDQTGAVIVGAAVSAHHIETNRTSAV